jgi:hypothetical protein
MPPGTGRLLWITGVGLRRNCSALVRRALWLVAAALWAEEVGEALTSWRGLDPRADGCLDNFTVVLSIALVVWTLQEHYARRHADIRRRDEQVAKLTNFAGAVAEKAGVDVSADARASQPSQVVRLGTRRKGA